MADTATKERVIGPDITGEQTPHPETTSITLRNLHQVPDVTGKPFQQALTDLTSAGLVPHVSSVRETLPVAGAMVSAGSNVWLVLTNDTTVPDVIGEGFATAMASVRNAGLYPTVVERLHSQIPGCPAQIQADQVGGMLPAAGTTLPIGGQVTLFVVMSTGTVKVPNVVGMSVTSAERILHNAGLMGQRSPVNAQGGWTVMSTSPAFGRIVVSGSVVRLNARTGPPQ